MQSWHDTLWLRTAMVPVNLPWAGETGVLLDEAQSWSTARRLQRSQYHSCFGVIAKP
tara:strand:+ start:284 stop:454 length:171 start_codon:yes stop_codon:yes gene_type:complete